MTEQCMEPKVTVIMPVYNSEEYVAGAIESVLTQDFEDFELILVDDGSSDGSGAICDGFSEKDPRVRVMHIHNGGMCHARNLAMDAARGEYVTFCDNDDECLPGFLGENYAIAKEHNADVVRFGRNTQIYRDDSTIPEEHVYSPQGLRVLRGQEIYKHFKVLMYGSNGVWTGLYRRSMLTQYRVRFNEELRRGCEDKIFNLDAFDIAQTVCTNPKVYYVWRRRVSHSSSMAFDDNYYLGIGLYIHRLKRFLDEHGVLIMDPEVCAKEMLSPFREMVGARARSGSATLSEDIEFCAKVHAIYDGYWDAAYLNPKTPQALVLSCLMSGNYFFSALVIRAWRLAIALK